MSGEEKTSSSASCFSSVTGEEKEAEVGGGGGVSVEERQPLTAVTETDNTLEPLKLEMGSCFSVSCRDARRSRWASGLID